LKFHEKEPFPWSLHCSIHQFQTQYDEELGELTLQVRVQRSLGVAVWSVLVLRTIRQEGSPQESHHQAGQFVRKRRFQRKQRR